MYTLSMKSLKKVEQKNKTGRLILIFLSLIVGINLFFYTNAADPFNTPKLVLLLILTTLIMIAVIDFVTKISYQRFSLTNLVLAVLVFFLLSMLVSAFSSKDLLIALFGEQQRRLGWITYMCLSIVFIYSIRITNFKTSLLIYKIAIINNFLLSIYGLIQFTGNDFVSWNNPYNSIIGTLGNPNFASSTLAVLTALSLASLAIPGINILWKIIGVLSSLIAIVCIVQSNSRQGLVVLFLSCGVYVAIRLLQFSRSLGLVYCVIFFGLSILSVGGMLQKGPFVSLLYKPSVTLRGYYWDAGLSMFKKNPVTGIGPDQYGDYFREYRKLDYPLKYGFDIGTTNAHNVFIQFFATGGIFVGLAYSILCAIVVYCAFSLLTKTKGSENIVVLGIFTGWLAYQAQSIISIDNIGMTIWGWILGGTLVGIRLKYNSAFYLSDNLVSNAKSWDDNLIRLFSYFLAFPFLLTALLLMKSEVDAFDFTKFIGTKDINKEIFDDKIANILENPLALPSYKIIAIRAQISIEGNWFENSELKKLAKSHPRNAEVIYTNLIYAIQDKNLEQQLLFRTKISQLDPWNLENYLQMVDLHKSTGDLVAANNIYQKMKDLSLYSEQTKAAQKIIESK